MAKYELKTKKNNSDVYEFINSVDDDQQRQDSLKLIEMFKKITGHKPVMWGNSIVGFGSYHYKYASGQEGDWMAIGFSPRKQNLTIYLMPGFALMDKMRNKLGKHSIGKGCLYIKRLSDVDEKILKQMIKNSYNYVIEKMDKS